MIRRVVKQIGVCLLYVLLVGKASSAAPATDEPSSEWPSKEIYRNFAMTHEGDAARGKALFQSQQRLACVNCHTVDGSGELAGPDLIAVGDTFERTRLIRAVLEPSAEIAIGFASVTVTTHAGEEYTGVLKDQTTDFVVLVGADASSVRIPTSEVREQRTANISFMPEGLHQGLTKEEFTDLIDYLETLKLPEDVFASKRGMPRQIPVLARPVTLRPFMSEDLRFPHAFVERPGDVRNGLTWFEQMPGTPHVFMVGHQTGNLWLLEKTPDGVTKTLFADFSGELFNERGPNGLLGLTFHPLFRQNRKYYLKHQVFENDRIVTVVVEKQAAPDFRRDSGKPSRPLIKMVSTTQNHSGGCIQFGPDSYLYIGMGDTGPQGDPRGHGQDLGTPLGKILRLDVDTPGVDLPYSIPPGNPFLDLAGARPEIWALGFREPWRFSFDPLTGELWVGDVGQDRVEEITIVRRGENHGWNVMEGFEPFSDQYRRGEAIYVPPVFAYLRKYGNSVTGGYVYRGDPRSPFYGTYICGDYTSRRIWAIQQEDRVLKSVVQIATSPQGIASFGTDEEGNIYVVGYEGMIYQLDFTTAQMDPAPDLPSQPALVAPQGP